ncbi:MAG: enoyl-CoA hydratase/isomerase family protein [Gemmatimonadetes bacterium]|nr:enoyl-CoA hydratase/isomerase family protein [Gemmatimonadota bacterium]
MTDLEARIPPLRIEPREEDVLAIVLDRPDAKVNLIDEAWLHAMTAALDEIERARPAGIVLVSAKPGNFIAGADVSLIASLETPADAERRARQGQELLSRLEDLPVRKVAAIRGACLGGGLETALAFDWIVVADDDRTVLGLPEVRLGILPGFGGTWRLPKRTGILAGLPLVLTGRTLRPRQAEKLGLADRLASPELVERVAIAIAAGREKPKRRRPVRARMLDFLAGRTPPGRALLRNFTEKNVAKETGGHYPAPPRILERVLDGYGTPRGAAMAREAAAFGQLAVTPEAKNLLFLFTGNEELARHPWTGRPAPADATTVRAAVLGAGTMGGGIAGSLAGAGIQVRLRDVAVESLRVGLAGAAGPLNRRVQKRRMKPRDRDAVMERISPATDLTGLTNVDVVIEAVPEILELKQKVFREVEGIVRDDTILATNTSSIPIDAIAHGIEAKERLVGLHFFNPVHRMPLVEVIPGARTRDGVLEGAVGLVRRLKKSPLVVADRPGFLVNRLLLPYLNEAALAVQDGWPIPAVDGALLRFGMPMGPLRVLDEVGLDVAAKVSHVLEDAFGTRARPAPLMQRLLEAGALGTKAGRGFWVGTGRERTANTQDLGGLPAAPAPPDEEIVERLLSGMINEAARCLAEGVVRERDHLDLGTVLGAGFPPFRGGLARWALSLGEDEVRRRLDALAARYGERFAPFEGLGELFRNS